MTSPATADNHGVLVRKKGRIGHLTLNRPAVINALNIEMISLLSDALDAWTSDPEVEIVLLDGTGERGLCAGGDVRTLYDHVVAGDIASAVGFFRAEYALNAQIAEYPKPIIALADGVTMGGGIGLAGHAAVRIVTERSKLAMPETRIGFTPDVGGTWLQGHAPGRVGEYLGMTGAVMSGADAIYAGFADHLVSSESLDQLREALYASGGGVDVAEVISPFRVDPGPSPLQHSAEWIDDAFAADTVQEIAQRLRARDEGTQTAEVLAELSPTAITVALAAIRRSRELPNLRDALAQEYGLVMWFVDSGTDLAEGIRAQLVDKDRAPKWKPATLAEVPTDIAARALTFTPDAPLWG